MCWNWLFLENAVFTWHKMYMMGLLTVPTELPESKEAVLKNKTKSNHFRLSESVIAVIFLIVLLKHDVITSIAEHGVYCACYLCFWMEPGW